MRAHQLSDVIKFFCLTEFKRSLFSILLMAFLFSFKMKLIRFFHIFSSIFCLFFPIFHFFPPFVVFFPHFFRPFSLIFPVHFFPFFPSIFSHQNPSNCNGFFSFFSINWMTIRRESSEELLTKCRALFTVKQFLNARLVLPHCINSNANLTVAL